MPRIPTTQAQRVLVPVLLEVGISTSRSCSSPSRTRDCQHLSLEARMSSQQDKVKCAGDRCRQLKARVLDRGTDAAPVAQYKSFQKRMKAEKLFSFAAIQRGEPQSHID